MLIAILAVSAALALVSAVLFQAPGLLGREKILTDFDAFYVAGIMADRQQASETYHAVDMIAAQQEITGTRSFMPWAYPPPYTLFVQGLAQLPIGVAFLLFIVASFAFYLSVLRQIAGAYLPGVLIAILPTILITVRTGQNGFLIAGLIGCFILAFMRRRAIAGVPLGLMVIKPHLAAGIALLALVERRWVVIGIAAAISAAALLASTVVFGTGIWPAFFGGVREAGQFLAAAYYPMFRMSSIFATVRVFTGSTSLALAFQAIGALAGVIFLVFAWYRCWKPRTLAAVACIVSLLVSPYNYDYDLAILGVAIALVLPDIVEHTSRRELFVLLLLSWATTGYGYVTNAVLESSGSELVTALGTTEHWPLTAPFLLVLVVVGTRIVRRVESTIMNPVSFAGEAEP